MSESVLPMFSSRSFIVSGLTLRSLYNGLKTLSLTIGAGKSGQPLVKE